MSSKPRAWLVAGAILFDEERLLLVQNRRRNGSLDWSPPGGVVDEGEDALTGLQREVVEETGLVVDGWSDPRYLIHASAPDMGWDLRVEARQATSFSGELILDDPDGIVIAAEWVPIAEVEGHLAGAPQWVREPLVAWLSARDSDLVTYRYEVVGSTPSDVSVNRVVE